MTITRNRLFSAIANCGTSTQQCLTALKNNHVPSIAASIILVGAIEILDFMCNQIITDNRVDWNYYSQTPTRILWLILLSIGMGWNLEKVVTTIKADAASESIPPRNKISPLKVFVGCSAYYMTMHFAQLALTKPISAANAVYIAASTLLNGPIWGTLLTSGGYFLQRLNYSIKPFTLNHAKFISAGIVMSTLHMLIDYMCKQMIEDNVLNWEPLYTPPRLLAWNMVGILLQGVTLGIAAISVKKYSIVDGEENQRALMKFRNVFLAFSAALTPLTVFTQLSLTTPINSINAPYIVTKSFVTGSLSGLIGAASTFVLIKLRFFPEEQKPTPIAAEASNSQLELDLPLIVSGDRQVRRDQLVATSGTPNLLANLSLLRPEPRNDIENQVDGNYARLS